MDQGTRMNSMPPAPIFGVAGCEGGAGAINSKFINIDEIFADCFMEGEGSDLLGLESAPGANAGGGVNNNAAGGVGSENTNTIGGTSGGVGSLGGVGAGDPGMLGGVGGVSAASAAGGVTPFGPGLGDLGGRVGAGGTSRVAGAPQSGGGVLQQQQQLGGAGGVANNSLVGISPFGAADAGGGRGASTVGIAGGKGTGRGAGMSGARIGGATGATPRTATGRGGGGGGGFVSGSGGEGRGAGISAGGMRSASMAGLDDDDDDDDGTGGGKRGAGGKRPRQGGRNMTEQQRLDRRERNREHAKRSRVRKKFLLESLQKSVTALQEENEKLRGAIRSNLGTEEATELLAQTDTSSLIASNPGDATQVLDDPDYSLVKALQTAQQNFVITDPTLPDNPIVFASQGFLELTGYTLDQVLGRNCRFLQGPDTDPKAVEKIRKAIEKGMDTSVCLRNYRVDGAMFWNQFFIAALRDSEGAVINYVGVQCKVDEEFVRAVQKREGEDDGEEEEEMDEEEDRSDGD